MKIARPFASNSARLVSVHHHAASFLNHSFTVFGYPLTPQQVLFWIGLIFCLTPWASPPVALGLGLLVALVMGNPFATQTHKYTSKLLQYSVIGLGFGINASAAAQAGRQGFIFTIATIFGTLVLGYGLGRWLGIERKTAHLISCGTAICGGSAIAAVGPVLQAEKSQFSVALGTVFVLNSVALLAFPALGHALQMTQNQFGLWCAIAIHDTSSVVGAASHYGDQALQVATTVKLSRALWIIPVALGTAFLFKTPGTKVKLPYFILGFIGAMLLTTYVPALRGAGAVAAQIAKIGLTLTLFLIGTGLSMEMIRKVGVRPFGLGIILWVLISATSLWVILHTVA
ncbi:YeiH family protein [Hymenobacter radiodurans]|uniref:YeiH family protein n=1 Tax=Hymenobacter radiodurans TaxID=2496028 RepID=UPI001058BBE6|nr:putative sulfate exporter family transporter [Hymenobacter radiodurans]